MKRLFAFFLLIFCCSVLSVKANTLYGQVVEVQDGKTMTVENTGRRVKVALKLAEPPDTGQPYADVARLHLSGLVLGRQVSVDYTGLGENAMLLGRVFCDNRDVGLQMIRDGVAWYEKTYVGELNDAERRIYADSEQAARGEHRGIWQDAAPVAPWEWKKASAEKANAGAGIYASTAAKTSAAVPSTVPVKAPLSAAKPAAPVVARTDAGKWPLYSPANNLFSIRVPGNGHELSAQIDLKKGGTVEANFYWVNHLKIGYIVLWASGPHGDETLSTLFDKTVEALSDSAAAHGFACEFGQEKDVPMKGFTGRRFNIQGCYYKGAIRNYFKIEGKTLKVFYIGVVTEDPNNPAIKEFLDSFVIN